MKVKDQLVERFNELPTGVETLLSDAVADEIGVTRRAVEQALGALDSEGVIVWHRKTRGGVRRPWYVITRVAQEVPQ